MAQKNTDSTTMLTELASAAKPYTKEELPLIKISQLNNLKIFSYDMPNINNSVYN